MPHSIDCVELGRSSACLCDNNDQECVVHLHESCGTFPDLIIQMGRWILADHLTAIESDRDKYRCGLALRGDIVVLEGLVTG